MRSKCKTYKFSHNFLSSANLLIYCILYISSSCSPPHWDSFKLYFTRRKIKVSWISLFESLWDEDEQQLGKRKFFTSKKCDMVTLYENCSREVKDEWGRKGKIFQQTTAVKKFPLSWCEIALLRHYSFCILKTRRNYWIWQGKKKWSQKFYQTHPVCFQIAVWIHEATKAQKKRAEETCVSNLVFNWKRNFLNRCCRYQSQT